MTNTYHLDIGYTNYKGGINNLQYAKVKQGYSLVKAFTSQKHQAIKRAERYLSKLIKQ